MRILTNHPYELYITYFITGILRCMQNIILGQDDDIFTINISGREVNAINDKPVLYLSQNLNKQAGDTLEAELVDGVSSKEVSNARELKLTGCIQKKIPQLGA